MLKLSKPTPNDPPFGPGTAHGAVGQQKGRPGGGLCRPWIWDRRCLGRELRDSPAWCANTGADSGGDVPGAPRTPYSEGVAREKRIRARLRGSYLALIPVDIADGVGHRVRAQQHACATWPLGAHKVVLAHEDLAYILRARHTD